jgi:hypothetical protein
MSAQEPHDPLAEALNVLARSLREYLAARPQLRQTANALARMVLEVSREPEPAADQPAAPSPSETPASAPSAVPVTMPAAPVQPSPLPAEPRAPEIFINSPRAPVITGRVQLQIGDAKVEVPVDGTKEELEAAAAALPIDEPLGEPSADRPPPSDELGLLPDLTIISRRCRLKAEACRFAAQKRLRLAQGANFFTELQPVEYDLRRRIEAVPDCYIPVLKRDAVLSDDESMERLARAYDNLAAAADVVSRIEARSERQPRLQRFCDALARAQSALRRALEEAWISSSDSDQRDVFDWLVTVTRVRRVYTPWMRIDSPADPGDWSELADVIAGLAEDLDQDRRRRQALRRIAYEADQIRQERGSSEHHWRTLLDTLETLVKGGFPASDPELRDLLAPLADLVPAGIEPGAQARTALREAERLAPEGDTDETPDEPEPEPPPGVVHQAAALLKGRTALIIGGMERPEAAAALRSQLGLAELRWLTKRPHASTAPFETHIARPEVEVVFFLTKLANKHDGPSIRALCREHGKACIMLRAGYNPAQVAHQFLQQASERFSPQS